MLKEVETLYLGCAPIRGKYIMYCKAHQEPLTIEYHKERMMIAVNELDTRIKMTSKKPVKDKWGKELDYIYYYEWKADVLQRAMF